mgnify:CR=1 FL=1
MTITPVQSQRYARMVNNFAPDEAKAYWTHLLNGGTAEEFFAKYGKISKYNPNHGADGRFSSGGAGGGGVAFGGASFVALCAKSCRCGGTSGPSSASKAEISSALGALSLFFSPLAEGVFLALFFAAVFFTGASLELSATGVALG